MKTQSFMDKWRDFGTAIGKSTTEEILDASELQSKELRELQSKVLELESSLKALLSATTTSHSS